MSVNERVKEDISSHTDKEKAEILQRFFKTFPGGYGEGDIFLGVTVPKQRAIAKKYYEQASLREIESLLREGIHEFRLTALFMLVYRFEKRAKLKDEVGEKEIFELYLRNSDYVNNWDLVDSSAHKIVGAYILNRDRDILYELAESGHLWRERIAVIATLYLINQNDFGDALNLARYFLNHRHDLIHKAVGWMLREIGKRDYEREYDFLLKHYKKMPRTTLRYAIEKFSPAVRQQFLKGHL